MTGFDDNSPKLTLDPIITEKEPVPTVTETKQPEIIQGEEMLSEEEKNAVEEFKNQIDIRNSQQIMSYGAGTQQKMANFSEKALENVRSKDMGEIGEMITGLVTQLNDFEPDASKEKGIMGFFKKTSNKISNMKLKYDKVEGNVNKIVESLEGHQVQLIKDMSVLDQMYETNRNYYKELTMYILAGKKKIMEIESTELAELKKKAELSKRQEDAQAYNDLLAQCDRFDKKLADLELSRMISIQTAPQIRIIQNNDAVMAEKIQSTIVNTIPIWKNQMVIALGLAHSEQAVKAQRAVTDITNEMLKRNAEKLKIAATETAREAQRGIVDIETLKNTNTALIETLDEVMKINEEGRVKRREAEEELRKMEDEVKSKLLEIKR